MKDGRSHPSYGCLTTFLCDLAKATPAQLRSFDVERVAADRGLRVDYVRGYLERERQARQ